MGSSVYAGPTGNNVNELEKTFALGFANAPCHIKMQKNKKRTIGKRRYFVGSCSNGYNSPTILQQQLCADSELFQARVDSGTEKNGELDDNIISEGNVYLGKDSLLLFGTLRSANLAKQGRWTQ